MKTKFSIASLTLLAAMYASAQQAEQTDSLIHELEEITVTAKQPATRLEGMTLVSTITGTDLSRLGTCLDVLGQLPMITVSDNNVSVTGKGTPEIYIDGRPMRDSEELRQLRSENVKKVELDLAPGAAYAGDTRAVIRISTHRTFMQGLSLTERAEVSVRRKFSANNLLDLNYRFGDWDIFASGTIARNNSEIKGQTTNRLIYNGKETIIGSSQHNTYPSVNGSLKAGLNYGNETRSLGAYYRYSPESGDFNNNGKEWIDDEEAISRLISRHTTGQNHLVSAYYDALFGRERHLHFDGVFHSAVSRNAVATSYPDTRLPDVESRDRRASTLWGGKLYLDLGLWHGRLTIGIQDSYTRSTLDYEMLNPEVATYIPSAFSENTQVSLASFASFSRDFGALSMSIGARHEYLNHKFMLNGTKDNDISRKNNILTPDINLGYQFNGHTRLGLSYKMRTRKPPYTQLTGSLSFTGTHEIEGGNPSLRDEHVHDLQLLGTWNGFILQADYTRCLDSYTFVKRLYPAPTLQLLLQPINVDVSALDVYLVWSKRINVWTPNITAGMSKQWLDIAGTHYGKPMFSCYFENLISLPQGFLVEINLNWRSAGDINTSRFGSSWFETDISVSKPLLNDTLQLRLTGTDIFNTASNDWSMYTFGIQMNKAAQKYDRRGISLALTWRLNPRRSKYKGQEAAEAELKRL